MRSSTTVGEGTGCGLPWVRLKAKVTLGGAPSLRRDHSQWCRDAPDRFVLQGVVSAPEIPASNDILEYKAAAS